MNSHELAKLLLKAENLPVTNPETGEYCVGFEIDDEATSDGLVKAIRLDFE